MEHSDNIEEQNLKRPFTIFGQQVIKTRCQRNALITGISGGVVSGLVAFLVTSQARKSMNIAIGSYFTISFSLSCYCAYNEYTMRKQGRMIKAAMYELNKMKEDTEPSDMNIKLENF